MILKLNFTVLISNFYFVYFQDVSETIMWLAASEASSLGYEEVCSRLRVDVRQGLTWQEAAHRRQITG